MTITFNQKLTELLKKDLRFVDEKSGELIRSEIVNETLKIDKKHYFLKKKLSKNFLQRLKDIGFLRSISSLIIFRIKIFLVILILNSRTK